MWFLLGIALLWASPATAHTYLLDSPEQALVGAVLYTRSRHEDTLMDIGRTHGMGFRELRLANPDVDVWIPGEGTQIVLPAQFILPDAPREGIVINRAEKRLYHYHTNRGGERQVTTYPVGIGRIDRETPVGQGRVTDKLRDPAWYPTEQAIIDHAVQGRHLPAVVPPGPDNPLGRYALVLDIPGYLIHGTNRPDGIGMRVSQGCIRLYPENIETLVARVSIGTLVTLVDQPHKLGLQDGRLWVEVHPTFDALGHRTDTEQELVQAIATWQQTRGADLVDTIDWLLVSDVYRRASGIPTAVSGR